jgi:hypothetical protein
MKIWNKYVCSEYKYHELEIILKEEKLQKTTY